MAKQLDVTKDPALNRFITGVLENARSDEKNIYAEIGNVQIDRTVEQLRAFCPEAYEGEETGGNANGGEVGNVTAWPERVGA
jgi:hypothetical protein